MMEITFKDIYGWSTDYDIFKKYYKKEVILV